MAHLIQALEKLKLASVRQIIDQRLKEFDSYKDKNNKAWFSELCFCILTANSKVHTALNIQAELGVNGFIYCSIRDLSKCIRRNKHRFHNNKARYIAGARGHLDIKKKITAFPDEFVAREWLVQNIKSPPGRAL